MAQGLTLFRVVFTLSVVAKTKSEPKDPPSPEFVKVQFRFPPELLSDLDAWVIEFNKDKKNWPAVTRSDLVRNVLQWAVRVRPNLEEE